MRPTGLDISGTEFHVSDKKSHFVLTFKNPQCIMLTILLKVQGYICNPGATFTVIGNAAGCVSATDHVTIMQTSCSDTSVLVGPPGYTPYTW